MKHVTAPFSKQLGTTTSKINSRYTTSRGYSTWAGKFSLMLLFLFVSQLGIVAQICNAPSMSDASAILPNDCTTIPTITGQSGNVFELTINPANQYVFTICFAANSAGNSQFPQAELFADLAGTFIAATGTADANNCTTVTYTPGTDCTGMDANLVYLATYSHQCISDWRDLTIDVTCTACAITCAAPQFIAANNSGCLANSFTVSAPTVSGSCAGNTVTPMASADLMPFTTPNADGTISVAAGAPVGTHTITFSVTDCAGVVESCVQTIVIEPIMACDDTVNVTLSQFCELQVTPGMLLEAECADDSQYRVNILGQTNDIISAPGLYEVQIVYTPDIENSASGNFCWGFINAEDKSGPTCTIDRTQISISCGESADGGEPVFEDCSGVASSSMISLSFGQCGEIDLSGTTVNPDTDGDGDLFDDLPFTVSPTITIPALNAMDPEVAPFIAAGFVIDNVTVNMWTATDTNGFSTNACQQFIYTWRPSTVNPPQMSITVECGSAIDQNSLAAIDPTFLPHYNNPLYNPGLGDSSTDNDLEFTLVDNDGDLQFLPITDANNSVCRFNVDSNDKLVGETCGMTEKYIREFTVIDWCRGSIVTGIDDFSQIIVIEDSTAPEIDCVAATEVGGSFANPIILNTTSSAQGSCGFDGILTPPSATDFCSAPVSFSASIFTSGGTGTGYILVSQVQDLSNNVSLPQRDYRVDYVARDECGNLSAPCSIFYDIIDNDSPVAICNGETTVSLTNANNGVASICASNLDNGSNDNCGIATRMVKRMGTDDSTFAPCLDLNCTDAGQEIMVVFRVTDAAGNSNICMVSVEVQDKVAPVIVCPADITVSCMDATTVDVTGDIELNTTTPSGINGYAFDNCGINAVNPAETSDIDCGAGVIERTFTAFTSTGIATCTQTITIEPDFNYFVTFPADMTIEGCAGDVDVSMTGAPVISGETCAELGIHTEDMPFTVESGACSRIVRTFTIRNTCVDIDMSTATAGGIQVDDTGLKFQDDGDGYFSYSQIIDVVDETKPVFNNGSCDEQFFYTFDTDCNGSVNIDISATDNCTDDLEYLWRVDIFGNGVDDEFGSDNSIEGTYPVGTHVAFAQVSDGCGNTETCNFVFSVRDQKEPTPFCTQGVNTVIMNGPSNSVDIWASDLILEESITDNCTNNEDIIVTMSFANDPNPSEAPSATSLTITCDQLVTDAAGNALPTTFTVQIFVQDEQGNFAFCTSEVEVIDTDNDCGTTASGSAQIAGRIFNEDQEDIDDVTVNVINTTQNMPPYVTQTDGAYVFPDLDMNDDYTVAPEKDMDIFRGVSTFDIVLLAQHLLGINPLDSPYKLLAADVNLDGQLNITDLLEIRQLILLANDEYSSGVSWLFVDADYVFQNPASPFSENYPQVIDVDNLSSNVSAANFIGVKLGDIDNDGTVSPLLDVDERSFNPTATMTTIDQKLVAGEEVVIPLQLNNMNQMAGMQFTMEFNPDNMEFVGFNEGTIKVSDGNFGFRMLDEGIITFSWNTFAGTTIEISDQDLFELRFKAKRATDIASELQLSSKYTAASAFNDDGAYNVALNVLTEDGLVINTASFELYQNQPNPFKVNTNISFNLPEASAATLRIMDISGKELSLIKGNFNRGYNEINLDLSSLKANGVMYFQLETATHAATKKMIVIE